MDIQKILELHEMWLNEDPDGVRADLQGADLRYADLRYADLQNANLRGADLRYADLRHADLWYADLRGADLQNANLRGADLWGADLQGADLRYADLRYADLRGANVDYSCLPLWWGSLHMKVDKRIAAQIAYHFCALECDDPEVQETQRALYTLANTFHRVGELPRLGG